MFGKHSTLTSAELLSVAGRGRDEAARRVRSEEELVVRYAGSADRLEREANAATDPTAVEKLSGQARARRAQQTAATNRARLAREELELAERALLEAELAVASAARDEQIRELQTAAKRYADAEDAAVRRSDELEAARSALRDLQARVEELGGPDGYPVEADEPERRVDEVERERLAAFIAAGPWRPFQAAANAEEAAEEARRRRHDAEIARLVRDGRAGIAPESQGGPPEVVTEARRQLDAEIAAHRGRIAAAGKDPDAAARLGGGVVVSADRDHQPRRRVRAGARVEGHDDE